MNQVKEPTNQVADLYAKYRGKGITDVELSDLLVLVEAAIPYLSASPAFALVLGEALRDRETLKAFQSSREGCRALDSKPD